MTEPCSCQADAIIADLEERGLGWDICHAPFHFIEIRIWQWPVVITRHRPTAIQPLAEMLTEALKSIDLNNYPIKTWSSE